jgi:hypothetical protein
LGERLVRNEKVSGSIPLISTNFLVFKGGACPAFVFYGEMAERSKAHAWKACRLQKGLKGSNPFLSAIILRFQAFLRNFRVS